MEGRKDERATYGLVYSLNPPSSGYSRSLPWAASFSWTEYLPPRFLFTRKMMMSSRSKSAIAHIMPTNQAAVAKFSSDSGAWTAAGKKILNSHEED